MEVAVIHTSLSLLVSFFTEVESKLLKHYLRMLKIDKVREKEIICVARKKKEKKEERNFFLPGSFHSFFPIITANYAN